VLDAVGKIAGVIGVSVVHTRLLRDRPGGVESRSRWGTAPGKTF
jgi:hypothetical protein